MSYNQIKKQAIHFRWTEELGNPVVIIKLDIIKSIAKTENKIDTKLKIAKDSSLKVIFFNSF